MLDVLEQLRIVDGDGGLSAQGFEVMQPVGVGGERRAVEDFHHTFERAFGDERHAEVFDEFLALEQFRADDFIFIFMQVGDVDHLALQPDLSRHAFAKPQA